MHELNIRHQSAPDQVGKERNVCAQPDHMRDISFIHPPPFTSYIKINFYIYAKVFQFDSFLYIVFTSCLGTACNCNLRMRSFRKKNLKIIEKKKKLQTTCNWFSEKLWLVSLAKSKSWPQKPHDEPSTAFYYRHPKFLLCSVLLVLIFIFQVFHFTGNLTGRTNTSSKEPIWID